MSPRAVPGSRDQLKLQDLGVNVKGGQLWGGCTLTRQGQLKPSEVQKLALV